MSNYIIFTDSGCDILPEKLAEWQIPALDLTFKFDGDDKEYMNADMDVKTFFDRMRKGGVAKTSAVNMERFRIGFEEILKEGNDILYLGFSGGLSTTSNSARLAADDLRDEYPERKIIVVDTLCASAGHGLIVYLTMQKKNEGATIEEAAEYAKSVMYNIDHWVTVDDLVYLKRGGRISPTVAFVGNALGLKPIIHVDGEGKLVSVEKIRGRKGAINHLAEKYAQLALDKENGTIFISHADCIEDANTLADILKANHGVDVTHITYIGPVIGAHAGPGTLALFFVGKGR